MAQPCGVCHDSDSKYKCPTCELRYCSIKCYKSHKSTHDSPALADEPQCAIATLPVSLQEPSDPIPKPSHNPKRPPFSTLLTDPAFLSLFTRYPHLRAQLQLVYAVTLEPGPDEARSWNRAVRWDASATPSGGHAFRTHRSFRGRGWAGVAVSRGRGRGGRFGASSSSSHHSSATSAVPLEDEGLRGSWTREKGEKMGLGVMRRMRRGGEGEGEKGVKGVGLAEGIREFVDLCQIKFGGTGLKVG